MALPIGLFAQVIWETLAISIPTVWRARWGTFTIQDGDEKLRSWAGNILRQAQVDLQVTGLEHVELNKGPFIVVSNHQSLYDIPILFCALPLSLRMAAKKELFKTPIWGKAMLASGFVKLDRSNRKLAYEALGGAAAQMERHGISLYIAPEGTRTKDGKLGPFKRGAFEIARTMTFPLLPVVIRGAIDVHRSGEYRVNRGREVTVDILPPLDPAHYESAQHLREHVFTLIAEQLTRTSRAKLLEQNVQYTKPA